MKYERSSGVLLHPTSLAGPYGIGDLGPRAHEWLEFLASAGCSLWQVLPLGLTGYGDSPYQCFSAFAGNPYLVSPHELLKDGLLTEQDLEDAPEFPDTVVDYGKVIPWKLNLLDHAFEQFTRKRFKSLRQSYDEFRSTEAGWLDDYALFMALKDAHNGKPWVKWAPSLRDREPAALAQARQAYATAIQRQVFRQFLFFRQWRALKEHAQRLGIHVIGDIPIFVAHDSADVWASPQLFLLDNKGNPTVVAGVPPDYFSPTGQLWGNPLYNWPVHQADGYTWWLARLRAALALVDIVRLDHFRGFAACWQVPGRAKTAKHGRWVPGPGMDFFRQVQAALGDLPIIAEDLGVITPDVVEIRQAFGLPGMKIVQFGLEGDPSDPFLPHNYPVNCVVYTGTHDNDTALGWYQRVPEKTRDFYRRYLGRDGHDVSWDMIRAAWSSVAVFSLAPMQDLLSLDNHARMNYPGNPSGNWTWRMPAGCLDEMLRVRLREQNYLYQRLNPVTLKREKSRQRSLPAQRAQPE